MPVPLQFASVFGIFQTNTSPCLSSSPTPSPLLNCLLSNTHLPLPPSQLPSSQHPPCPLLNCLLTNTPLPPSQLPSNQHPPCPLLNCLLTNTPLPPSELPSNQHPPCPLLNCLLTNTLPPPAVLLLPFIHHQLKLQPEVAPTVVLNTTGFLLPLPSQIYL